MAEPVRLLVSDIDGTLVDRDKRLTDATVAAVRRLGDAGVTFALISARPLSGVLPIARQLGVEALVGAYNGGTIARADGAVLTAEHLPRDVAEEALGLLQAAGIVVWLFADGRWHAPSGEGPHTASERVSAGQEPVVTTDLAPLLDRIDKLVGVSDDEPLLAGLETKVADDLRGRANAARSQPYYLDVTALAAEKGAGVRAIAEAAGVPLAQTAVIGDGRNDLAMFKVAGLSIAMGQASDAVRAAADAVTASNAEDGVAAAIDRYILPRASASA